MRLVLFLYDCDDNETMTMSGYYYAPRPHSSSNWDGARRRDNDCNGRYRRRTWEWESNNDDDNEPVRNLEYRPPAPAPATASAEAEAEGNADFGFGLIMPAAKKRRTSDHHSSLSPQSHSNAYQYHPYPYQMQNLNGSFQRGWNEESSAASAFTTMMPNMYKTSSATYEEPGNGKRPSQNWNKPLEQQQEGGDTTIQNPYLPHYHPFQVFLPSYAQAQLQQNPLSHAHPPQKQKCSYRVDNQLPLDLAAPYPPSSPLRLRHQFGDEYFMSPERRSSPVPVAHLKGPPPPASTVEEDTKEMKAKNKNAGLEGPVDLPPILPNLQVKGARTRTANKATATSSRHRNVWDRKFNELLEYKRQHGHCDVPQTYAPNPSLGLWVNKQRMEHKNRHDGKVSTLTDERLERLQSIGFRWAKRRGQVRWDEKYNELLQYAAKFGNCHVPTKFKENSALGRWVSTQRAEYKKFCNGQKSSMTNEKIRRLDSIGFVWFMAL